jgi:peptidoglycan/xylan/chitin deacetylase (PgdA/CDA1 family)
MMAHIGITFHGIGEPGRTLEPGEAPYWVDVPRFEAVLAAISATASPARFVVTFDDGNHSDHAIALPRLKALGIPGLFFVLTGRMGKPGSLAGSHLRELLDAGMAIGSHGADHRDWTRLSERDLEAEVAGSRRLLQDVTGTFVEACAIPFGSYNHRVLDAVRRAGYLCAYTSDRGTMNAEAFVRPRSSIRGTMEEAEIAGILAGHLPPLARLRRALGMARKRLPLG